MHKGRLEAFSDGVIAIIITIMVLELKVPHGSDYLSLLPLGPVFLSYIMSFVYIGIYWNNHHHLFQAVHSVNGRILWANLHLLFWLSIIPAVTSWMGENSFRALPTALYGMNLIMAAIAYTILTNALLGHHGANSVLAKAIGSDKKGKLSLLLYALAIGLAFFWPWVSYILYISVAVIWLVPDKRIENIVLAKQSH